MVKPFARTASAIVLGVALTACESTATSRLRGAGDSGFLSDYSQLREVSKSQGRIVREWASPKFVPANYRAIMLDPLIFYPEPVANEHVGADELKKMIAYADAALRQELSVRFNVVKRSGPGVAQIRIAFSSVAAQGEGLQPLQYVPIALVATMASRAAAGGAPQRAFIVAEAEATDSITGEVLGRRVQIATGERLPARLPVITLEAIRPALDELVANSFPDLSQFVMPR